MTDVLQSMETLHTLLAQIDGEPFESYQKLSQLTFGRPEFQIRLVHIQGSPGAYPASVGHLTIRQSELGLVERHLSNEARRLATADFLLRAFQSAIVAHTRPNRGVQGSGSFQRLPLPPQVLQRNVVAVAPEQVRIAFHISLPGSHDNRICGDQSESMLVAELAAVVQALKVSVTGGNQLDRHCAVIEDWAALQNKLASHGLIAFIGDGAVLPRKSGVSQAPLESGAVRFQAPDRLAVQIELPNAGLIRGLGIRPGVNVIIGGAFHGKTTLLDALAKGVYPHIPGDGRERVVTHPDAVFIRSEEGRAISGLDISGFIDNLPGHIDVRRFQTPNASGSTSEAAAIIEAVQAGAKLMLIDEDSSAANFLAKDLTMRALIPEDPVTPLLDRIRELYDRYGVSTLIAAGGRSEYLAVARQVIAMRHYLPVCMNAEVQRLDLPARPNPVEPLRISDKRRLLTENFDPACRVHRLGKSIAVRIKPLRRQEKKLEYGNTLLDLSNLSALVDPQQVLAIGYALLLARTKLLPERLSPSDLAAALDHMISKQGLDLLSIGADRPLFLARPRCLELAGAINRLRNLATTQ